LNAFAENLSAVETAIAAALKEAGREGPVEVIAVSKTQGEEKLREALAAGQRVFGENRVQEAKAKWPALKTEYPDIVLHLIGPLQSNKAAEAVALFDVIQSVDRVKIARAIAEESRRQDRNPRIFVQVNTGAEPQKAGVAPDGTDAFIAQCRDEFGLEIEGLMCLPPANEAPAPHFALLEKIARRNGLNSLSMGMSGDFEIGVQLGASHVRVGTALFGERTGA